jgi:hypothetical protein
MEEQLKAADELAKAVAILRVAKYGFGIPVNGDFEKVKNSFDAILSSLKPVENALAAYQKVRGEEIQ